MEAGASDAADSGAERRGLSASDVVRLFIRIRQVEEWMPNRARTPTRKSETGSGNNVRHRMRAARSRGWRHEGYCS
jgi:hypothetical protein